MWPFKQTPGVLNCQEAYNLWDMLQSRYTTIELINIFENFTHDMDFKLLTSVSILNLYESQVNELEEMMNGFGIGLPRRPPKSVRTPANTEAVEDRFIASLYMTLLQENISLHIRTIRTSLTNDNIRDLFTKYLKEELRLNDQAIKYFKLKGWLGAPPMYPQTPKGTTEKMDTGEAFHIWDHLTSRYDSIEITQIYQSYAHDPDFKTVLLIGLVNVLNKQVKVLEKEMDHFGLPLPQRPPQSAQLLAQAQIFEDELIFRQVFTGMQFMLELHATALRQNATNDRLRKIYIDFIWEEVDVVNTWIKYGKLKGWLRPVPAYQVTNKA